MRGIKILKLLGRGSSGSGGGGSAVNLNNAVVHGVTYAQWTIGNDGLTYKRLTAGAAVQQSTWIIPQTGMSAYDVRANLLSGSLPDGAAVGDWLNLGASYTWGWVAEIDFFECQLTVEIRLSSTESVIDSAVITIRVDGTS